MSERLKWLIVGTSASIIILVLNMTLSPTNEMSKHAVLPMTQAQNDSDTLFFPNEKIPFAWVMRAETSGNIAVAVDSSAPYDDPRNLKVELVDGRWVVESALPVRIKLQDGYLESNGDSLAMGFEYSDIANEYDELIAKLKAIKRRNTNIDTNYIRVERPKIKWREEKIWSAACQCSLVARRWYNNGDSSATIYYRSGIADTSDPRDKNRQTVSEYPALEARPHIRSMLDPRDYNKVKDWRTPKEIANDRAWLDSFIVRLDKALSDTANKAKQ